MNLPLSLLLALSCFTTQKSPQVSIITSIDYNYSYIDDFLFNIVAQTFFKNAELIIIDQTNSIAIEQKIKKYLKTYDNIIYIHLSEKIKPFAARNRALKIASAPYITYANLEDRRFTYSLEEHVKILQENPHIDILYGDYYCSENTNPEWYNFQHHSLTNFPDYHFSVLKNLIIGPFCIWRASLHEKYGFFNENLIKYSDLEMWYRAANEGAIFLKSKIPSGVHCQYISEKQGVLDKKNSASHIMEFNCIMQKFASF